MKIEKTVKYISGLAKQLQQEISMKNNIASSLKNEISSNSKSIMENIRNGNSEQATYYDLNTAVQVTAIGKNISVFGADGSSIEADRDLPLEFSAINIGYININYGDKPAAEFDESKVTANAFVLSFPTWKVIEDPNKVLSLNFA